MKMLKSSLESSLEILAFFINTLKIGRQSKPLVRYVFFLTLTISNAKASVFLFPQLGISPIGKTEIKTFDSADNYTHDSKYFLGSELNLFAGLHFGSIFIGPIYSWGPAFLEASRNSDNQLAKASKYRNTFHIQRYGGSLALSPASFPIYLGLTYAISNAKLHYAQPKFQNPFVKGDVLDGKSLGIVVGYLKEQKILYSLEVRSTSYTHLNSRGTSENIPNGRISSDYSTSEIYFQTSYLIE